MRGIHWRFQILNILKNKKNSFDVFFIGWVKLKIHFLKKRLEIGQKFFHQYFFLIFSQLSKHPQAWFSKKTSKLLHLIGGASFKFQRKRKTDNILVWRCCRCDCGMETTEALSLIKHPQHKRTCSHNSDTRPSTMEAAVTDADTAPEPQFVETTKKKTALLFEKHLYHKDTETLWRCAQRQSMNCKAGCHIIDNKVSSNHMIHTHEPLSDEKIKLLDIIVDVKRKAVEQPDEKPLHILASSIKNSFESGPTGLKNHDVSNIRQTIYRTRRRTFRSVPKQRRSCLRRLKEMASSGDEIVRSVRGNIVMIARKEDLKLLNVDRLALFGDGTFKYSPRFFNQMYTFFVFTNGFYKQPQKEDGFGECSGSLS